MGLEGDYSLALPGFASKFGPSELCCKRKPWGRKQRGKHYRFEVKPQEHTDLPAAAGSQSGLGDGGGGGGARSKSICYSQPLNREGSF